MSEYAAVLNYVRKNPGMTSTQIVAGLAQGVDSAALLTVELALALLVKNGIVTLTGVVPTGTYTHVSGRA